MAKNKDLKAAMNELKKNYKEVLKEAVQYATEEAQKDIHNKALSCLEEYYSNYDPKSYNRHFELYYSFLPYKSVQLDGDYIISRAGVEYNSDVLNAVAGNSYNASEKYGRVDSNWVLNNYLDGIHPTTNGSSDPNSVKYIPIIDAVSPTDKMKAYLTNYADTFRNNIYSYLAAYLLR